MGRPSWATPEQAAFLELQVKDLEKEKRNQGLKAFYARVTNQFVELWPSPVPPEVDTSQVTDPAKVKALSDDRRRRVSSFPAFLFRSALTFVLPANHRMV